MTGISDEIEKLRAEVKASHEAEARTFAKLVTVTAHARRLERHLVFVMKKLEIVSASTDSYNLVRRGRKLLASYEWK